MQTANNTTLALKLPQGPSFIEKGSTLKDLLDAPAITCLAHNISVVYPDFDKRSFVRSSNKNIKPLGIMQRGHHIAAALREHLPSDYPKALAILLRSLTPENIETESLGLGVFFYLPHTFFVSNYGLDYFAESMAAQHEITRRFTAEFSIRPFLIHHQDRTIKQLMKWTHDPSPHVRRLCSEGSRPRLPWAMRIPAFVNDPQPTLPILERLKDDSELYVRRSVANHIGDIAKDHPDLAFDICEKWLKGADHNRKWVIRHALRHPAKKENERALRIRRAAK
jgi:3-methyladenine DNA glycosylase AlkC